jgi:hypothetical protein
MGLDSDAYKSSLFTIQGLPNTYITKNREAVRGILSYSGTKFPLFTE